MPTVLGIETSCDETAVALVRYEDNRPEIISNVLYSQFKEHKAYGGVVPEVAARSHIEKLPVLLKKVLQQQPDIDAVAATAGPGLIGGVHVGYNLARAFALSIRRPFFPVNHLEAHALTVRLTNQIKFPFLLMLISGGHCQLIDVQAFRRYKLLGQTLDDSCGELFDKTAKMMGLGFPGGPKIEALAKTGNANAISFPKPLYKKKNCDFSFSGLKTAVKNCYEGKDKHANADIAASLQHTIAEVLVDRLARAASIAGHEQVVLAGGVAANQYIRSKILEFCKKSNLKLIVPPVELCTDNAAMIAWVGVEMIQHDVQPDLSVVPRPRWPLWEMI